MRPAVNHILRSWSPRLLSPALWLEARAATMFVSNAGTGGVTDGANVGYWRDLSPNGFDLSSAADDTTRPSWNLNGGFPYVDFNGVGDYLRRAADIGSYAAGSCSVFAAMRGNPGVDTRLVGSGSSAGNNPIYSVLQASSATASSSAAFVRNDAGTIILNSSSVLQVGAFDNTDRVYGCIDDGLNMTPYLDGVQGSPVGYTRSGSLTMDRFAVGALLRAAASNFFAGRVYALVVVNRVLSRDERAKLTRWLRSKMGS
jgi:hypothetical protein